MRTRLYAAGILGGLALLVVTAFIVFQFGRKQPSPDSLQTHPNATIPGELLFVDSDSCFVQAKASGETRRTRACIPNSFATPQLYWTADDLALFVRFDSRGGVLWQVDLNSGSQTDTGRVVSVDVYKPGPGGVGGGNYAPDGTYALAEQGGDLFLIEAGVRKQIASFDVAQYNQPQVLIWSPDSQWIVLQYYPRKGDGPELWIVSRDGKTRGTIARNVANSTGVAWRMDGLATQPPVP